MCPPSDTCFLLSLYPPFRERESRREEGGRGTKRGRKKFLSERKRTTGEKKGEGKEKEGGRRGTDIVA